MPHRRIESVRGFGSDIVMVYGGNCQWQTLHFVYSEKKSEKELTNIIKNMLA